ncbi:DUF7064 domain-containing protein [Pseudonocardia endophytica]|uniref:DUF7064 domain-containing protein n=1 Tax=Pseudonocardia endophytica TaxID=401976 RepID=A0A4R1HUF6_PSEEN|nr:hypothetical protein [Pseudonocardia endophytica]TCK26334.1 hypothetical protein EV378_2165 [Pseudonocardia endophytica]
MSDPSDGHDGLRRSHVRHDIGSGELARESLLFMFQLPEHGLGVSVYTWVKGSGNAGYAIFFYGGRPDGSTLLEHTDGIAVGDDVGFDRWKLGKLDLSLSPASDTATISVTGSECAVEFTFEGRHAPYFYSSSPGGCPQFFATDRVEQSGRVRGRLTCGDRVIDFDTQGHHDHSWGTRDWAGIQHYKWFEATTPTAAVHVLDIAGFGEHHVAGYVLKDSEIAEVRRVSWDVDYGADFVHEKVRLTAVDALDRETVVDGTAFAKFPFPVDTHTTLLDSVLEVSIERESGGGFADWCWPQVYLDHIRSR